MAKEEKTLPEKKPGKGNKFFKAIAGIPNRMINAVKNTIAELKKVTWPTRKDLINYTAIVLIFMVAMAIVVGLLDFGAGSLIRVIIQA